MLILERHAQLIFVFTDTSDEEDYVTPSKVSEGVSQSVASQQTGSQESQDNGTVNSIFDDNDSKPLLTEDVAEPVSLPNSQQSEELFSQESIINAGRTAAARKRSLDDATVNYFSKAAKHKVSNFLSKFDILSVID